MILFVNIPLRSHVNKQPTTSPRIEFEGGGTNLKIVEQYPSLVISSLMIFLNCCDKIMLKFLFLMSYLKDKKNVNP